MKRILFLICGLLLLTLHIHAQELTVKRFEVAVGDLSASVNQRNDLNGQACALVRVMLKDSGPKFQGNVLGDVAKDGLQYMVYLSAGTKFLRIVPADYFPIMVTFADYGIKSLEGKVTYNLMLVETGKAEPLQPEPQQQQQEQPTVTPITSLPTINNSSTSTSYHADPVVESFGSVHNASVDTIIANGVSFNMIRVEGGAFTMGATNEQGSDAYSAEKPAHQVTLPTFYIGETEVTQALWEAVMGSNPSSRKGSNLPVESVNWDDCQEFIRRLNESTGKSFRLPTEAEWEYAARGGNKSKGYKYSGSNTIDDVAWYDDRKTQIVKTKQANELGIYDMTGNVWEWCQDWYGSYSSNTQTNPKGPSSGSYRVRRGGSWGNRAIGCRVSLRNYSEPLRRDIGLGLRLAL